MQCEEGCLSPPHGRMLLQAIRSKYSRTPPASPSLSLLLFPLSSGSLFTPLPHFYSTLCNLFTPSSIALPHPSFSSPSLSDLSQSGRTIFLQTFPLPPLLLLLLPPPYPPIHIFQVGESILQAQGVTSRWVNEDRGEMCVFVCVRKWRG